MIAGGMVFLSCAGLAVTAGEACPAAGASTVQVVLDLDPRTPGVQSEVLVPAGTGVVPGAAVFIFDPSGDACVWGLGYLGGINRGIALGHMPSALNHGSVTGLVAAAGAPVNPGNTAWLSEPPALDPAFLGPEVQYVEGGAASPAAIPAEPSAPVVVVDILLQDAAAGDVFDFHLLDYVVVWSEGIAGAFSTRGPLSLDSGGDAVADGTQSIYGTDPDVSIPVPPAAFLVDYVDGPPGGGPATITVVPLGDLDGDGVVGILDLLALLAAWGPCPETCPADLDGDGVVGILDLLLLLASWG